MPKRILVVDTDDHTLGELAQFLVKNGYETAVATAGDDPVARFGTLMPELVFLNLQDNQAVSYCDGIRDNPDGAIVPVIFVGTGEQDVSSPSDALTQGGDYYFGVPLDLPKVLSKVQTYVGMGEPGAVDISTAPPKPLPDDEPAPAPPEPALPPLDTDDFPSLPDFGSPEPSDTTTAPLADASDDLMKAIQAKEAEQHEEPADIGAASDAVGKSRAAEEREAEERRHKAEEQARRKAEEQARRKAEEQARRRAQEEARRKAEEEARRKAEDEARRKAEDEAKRKAEEEAKRKGEEEAKRKAEEEAKRKAEEEAERKAEEEAERKAEEEAERKAEEEAERKAEEEAERKAEEEEAERKAEEEAERKAEEEAERKAEEEAERKAEEEAERKAEEKAERETEAEPEERAGRQAEEAAEHTAEEEAERQRQAEEEAERKGQGARREAERRAEEEIQQLRAQEEEEQQLREQIEEETRRRVEEELRKRHDEEARRRAEEERQRKAEEEARRKAEEEEARRKAEKEETRRKAEEEERERQAAEEIARLEEERRIKREAEAEAERVAAAEAEERERRRVEEKARRAVEEERRRLEEEAKHPGLPPPADSPPEPEAWHEPAIERRTTADTSLAPITPLEPGEGDFGGTADICHLLFTIWRQQVTGRVDFTCDSRKKTIFFERGGPVDAYSSQVFDRMEEFLYRESRITRAQYQDVRVKGLKTARKIGAHLVNEGHLKPHELFDAVRGHLRAVVFGVFEWESGTYVYTPERADEDDRVILDIDPRALIVEGIRRKFLMPRLMDLVGAPSSLLAPRPDATIDSDALDLRSEERQVVRLLDGTRSIEDLVFSTGMNAHRVYQVLAALVSVGYAEVRVRGIEGVQDDGTSASDTIDRQRIQEKVEHVRKLDYFQILGVPQVATPYEIDRAYERVIHEFQPNRFSEAVRRENAEQLQEIEHVLEDAREILRDEALRDAYARHLP